MEALSTALPVASAPAAKFLDGCQLTSAVPAECGEHSAAALPEMKTQEIISLYHHVTDLFLASIQKTLDDFVRRLSRRQHRMTRRGAEYLEQPEAATAYRQLRMNLLAHRTLGDIVTAVLEANIGGAGCGPRSWILDEALKGCAALRRQVDAAAGAAGGGGGESLYSPSLQPLLHGAIELLRVKAVIAQTPVAPPAAAPSPPALPVNLTAISAPVSPVPHAPPPAPPAAAAAAEPHAPPPLAVEPHAPPLPAAALRAVRDTTSSAFSSAGFGPVARPARLPPPLGDVLDSLPMDTDFDGDFSPPEPGAATVAAAPFLPATAESLPPPPAAAESPSPAWGAAILRPPSPPKSAPVLPALQNRRRTAGAAGAAGALRQPAAAPALPAAAAPAAPAAMSSPAAAAPASPASAIAVRKKSSVSSAIMHQSYDGRETEALASPRPLAAESVMYRGHRPIVVRNLSMRPGAAGGAAARASTAPVAPAPVAPAPAAPSAAAAPAAVRFDGNAGSARPAAPGAPLTATESMMVAAGRGGAAAGAGAGAAGAAGAAGTGARAGREAGGANLAAVAVGAASAAAAGAAAAGGAAALGNLSRYRSDDTVYGTTSSAACMLEKALSRVRDPSPPKSPRTAPEVVAEPLRSVRAGVAMLANHVNAEKPAHAPPAAAAPWVQKVAEIVQTSIVAQAATAAAGAPATAAAASGSTGSPAAGAPKAPAAPPAAPLPPPSPAPPPATVSAAIANAAAPAAAAPPVPESSSGTLAAPPQPTTPPAPAPPGAPSQKTAGAPPTKLAAPAADADAKNARLIATGAEVKEKRWDRVGPPSLPLARTTSDVHTRRRGGPDRLGTAPGAGGAAVAASGRASRVDSHSERGDSPRDDAERFLAGDGGDGGSPRWLTAHHGRKGGRRRRKSALGELLDEAES